MKFSCGHEADEPRNMGRGNARADRLAKYFNRKCKECRILADVELATSLTIPRTAEQQERAMARINREYL